MGSYPAVFVCQEQIVLSDVKSGMQSQCALSVGRNYLQPSHSRDLDTGVAGLGSPEYVCVGALAVFAK